MRAVIVQNPAAGNQKLHTHIYEVKEILHKRFDEIYLYQTEKPGDGSAFIAENHEDFHAVISAGGDGTVHELVNAIAILENRPLFGILPGGTCNDFARALNMPFDPLLAAEQLVRGQPVEVDLGYTENQYFSNFWGAGLITHVSENIDDNIKDSYGRLAYYLSTVQLATSGEPFHLHVNSPHAQYDEEATMVIVGNGPFTGGLKAFFPESSITDGLLDVLILKDTTISAFWEMIKAKMTNISQLGENIIYFQTDQLSIDTNPRQLIDSDGERLFKTPAKISVKQKHLQVINGLDHKKDESQLR